jgi:hypothetical protein
MSARTRRLPLVLALLLISTGLMNAAPATALPAATVGSGFSDVPTRHSYYTEITWLADNGIATGYSDGQFKPLNPVTRQAAAWFFYRFSGSPAFTPWRVPAFSDVPNRSSSVTPISWTAYTRVATGYSDGRFRPRDTVTRRQVAAFLYRLAGSPSYTPPSSPEFRDVSRTNRSYKVISWLADTGIAKGYGDGTFKPGYPVTRQVMAAFLYRFNAKFGAPGFTPPANPGDVKNCSDFSTWSGAQKWYEKYYPFYGDVAGLDTDNDGYACPSLPGFTSGDVCTSPTRKLTGPPSSGYSTQGYYLHNNMWNTSYALGPETLAACSYHSWYVTSRQTNHAGAVLTYPNVHKDYTDWAGYEGPRVSSFKSLTSRFAAKGPRVGIYNVAYDIWLNGVADNNSTEVMIWTENYRQVPAGSKVTSATFGGKTYDVWKTSDNRYIAFVPRTVMYSGTLDLLAMLKWLQGRGWLSSTATLGQVCFGVEVVHTGGTTARWDFTDFAITDS